MRKTEIAEMFKEEAKEGARKLCAYGGCTCNYKVCHLLGTEVPSLRLCLK